MIPPLDTDAISLKDQIDLWLKGLTFLFTAGVAIKVIVEYVRAQRWKRFEFIGQQIKDFSTDPQVRKVMTMLDWDGRDIELFPEKDTGKTVLVINDLLLASLYPDDYGPGRSGYTEEQARIREMFDAFFDKISLFSVFLKSGLIRKEDLHPHLHYWLERLANPVHKGQAFVENVNGYLEHYAYNDVRWLLNQFGYIR